MDCSGLLRPVELAVVDLRHKGAEQEEENAQSYHGGYHGCRFLFRTFARATASGSACFCWSVEGTGYAPAAFFFFIVSTETMVSTSAWG